MPGLKLVIDCLRFRKHDLCLARWLTEWLTLPVLGLELCSDKKHRNVVILTLKPNFLNWRYSRHCCIFSWMGHQINSFPLFQRCACARMSDLGAQVKDGLLLGPCDSPNSWARSPGPWQPLTSTPEVPALVPGGGIDLIVVMVFLVFILPPPVLKDGGDEKEAQKERKEKDAVGQSQKVPRWDLSSFSSVTTFENRLN